MSTSASVHTTGKADSHVELDFTTNKLKIVLTTPVGTFSGTISYYGPHKKIYADGYFTYKVDFPTILTISTANFYVDGNIKDGIISIDVNKADTKVGVFTSAYYELPDYIFVGSVTLKPVHPPYEPYEN